MIDVNFDFTSDTPEYWDGYWDRCEGIGGCGKYDPDSYSPTLLNYSQKIWSRDLPNGEHMQLYRPGHHSYFVWKDMYFSCDSITTSFRFIRNKKMVTEFYQTLPDYKKYMEDFTRRTYTLPGEIIFPMHRNSLNQRRGMSPKIRDRWDLTLECIRRYYADEESPLSKYLITDKNFFDLFIDFKGYIDYFFLNDCVTKDYSEVILWLGNSDFSSKALPQSVEDFTSFINNQDEFVEKRRERMKAYILSHGL